MRTLRKPSLGGFTNTTPFSNVGRTFRYRRPARNDLPPLKVAKLSDDGAPSQVEAHALSSLDESDDTGEHSVVTSHDTVLTVFKFPAALCSGTVRVYGSFNDWASPVDLRQSDASSTEFVRSMVLPIGPVTYKFLVDNVWQHSPRDPIVFSESGPNNQINVSVNTVITWPASLPAADVFVTGSFLEWGELVPLQQCEDGSFSINCYLPMGDHDVRFLVDGEWKVSPDLKTTQDPEGTPCSRLVPAPQDQFKLFYESQWVNPILKARHLDPKGKQLGKWTYIPLTRTQSRDMAWQTCSVPALRDARNVLQPSSVEFIVEGPKGAKDAGPGKGYRMKSPGGYKLRSGVVTPFPQACAPPMMVVSDLDGTMVGETPEEDYATSVFREYWEDIASLCQSVLVYNTGRSIGQFEGLYKHKRALMAMPDVVITAVGTKVFLLNRHDTRQGATGEGWEEDMEYARRLDQDWDLELVRQVAEEAVQKGRDKCHWLDQGYEHPHRIALNIHRDLIPSVVANIKDRVEESGNKVQFIESGPGDFKYLDVLSVHGGKRAAMEYVGEMYGIPKSRAASAGDSGNDILMLDGESPAIVVGNAQPALLDWVVTQEQSGRVVLTDKTHALGILEGLARHGLY